MTTAVQIAPLEATLEATTDQKALLEGLKFVSAALPTRPPMQVLLGVQLRASDAGITLAAFDYDLSAREMVAGHGTGLALVPGKLLLDIVKALDPGPMTLSSKGARVIVGQGDLAFTVPTLPIEDYPSLPTTDGRRLATATGADLVQLNRASVAVGHDDTLPVLTGIKLDSRDGKLVAAATDRYRLAIASSEVLAIDVGGALVPAYVLAFLAKHFPASTEVTLRINGDKNNVRMLIAQTGDRIVTARLLEGEFPRYAALIPQEFTGTATVDIADMVKAVKQVALVAVRHAPVRVGCSETGLLLEAGGQDDCQASKLVHAPFEGEPMAIAFNPGYLLAALGSLGKVKQARFRFNSSTRPAIIDNAEDPSFLHLLMPVRLNT